MKHTCHAVNCKTHCKPEMLMCFVHWKLVPRSLQQQVYTHYRPGQCDDRNPSPRWHAAADRAIAAVARAEGNYIVALKLDESAMRWEERANERR